MDKFYDYYNTESKNKRPWDDKKLQNTHYTNLLVSGEAFGFSDSVISNIDACGDVLKFVKGHDDRLHLYQTFFCKDRLCPICMWRRSLKRSTELNEMLNIVHEEQPSVRVLFLTLTVPNVKGEDLKNTIVRMNKGVTALLKYSKPARSLVGYVKQVEITVHRDIVASPGLATMPVCDEYKNIRCDNNECTAYVSYHPHVHLMLLVKSTYFKDKNHYINTNEWRSMWEKAIKWGKCEGDTKQSLVCYVETIKPKHKTIDFKDKKISAFKAASYESSKYVTKQKDYMQGNIDLSDIDSFLDAQVISVLHTQLSHLRLYAYGGILRKLYKELGYNENNYIKAKSDDEKDAPDDMQLNYVVAQWEQSKKGYYVHEEGTTTVGDIKASYEEYKKQEKCKQKPKLISQEITEFHKHTPLIEPEKVTVYKPEN